MLERVASVIYLCIDMQINHYRLCDAVLNSTTFVSNKLNNNQAAHPTARMLSLHISKDNMTEGTLYAERQHFKRGTL